MKALIFAVSMLITLSASAQTTEENLVKIAKNLGHKDATFFTTKYTIHISESDSVAIAEIAQQNLGWYKPENYPKNVYRVKTKQGEFQFTVGTKHTYTLIALLNKGDEGSWIREAKLMGAVGGKRKAFPPTNYAKIVVVPDSRMN